MRWFCTGHFTATWLVCTGLLFHFQKTGEKPLTFVLFALVLWPLVLTLIPIKGYFHLKAITLDRLKARVSRGELKKAVVFLFGFATSFAAALFIGAATLLVNKLDAYFSKQDGLMGMAHTLAWFPICFLLWAVTPSFVISKLAGRSEVPANA
jgi:hypothetical protein